MIFFKFSNISITYSSQTFEYIFVCLAHDLWATSQLFPGKRRNSRVFLVMGDAPMTAGRVINTSGRCNPSSETQGEWEREGGGRGNRGFTLPLPPLCRRHARACFIMHAHGKPQTYGFTPSLSAYHGSTSPQQLTWVTIRFRLRKQDGMVFE